MVAAPQELIDGLALARGRAQSLDERAAGIVARRRTRARADELGPVARELRLGQRWRDAQWPDEAARDRDGQSEQREVVLNVVEAGIGWVLQDLRRREDRASRRAVRVQRREDPAKLVDARRGGGSLRVEVEEDDLIVRAVAIELIGLAWVARVSVGAMGRGQDGIRRSDPL